MNAIKWVRSYFPKHDSEILKLIIPMSKDYNDLYCFYLQIDPDELGNHKLLEEYNAYPDPEDDGLLELTDENAERLFEIDPKKIMYHGIVDNSGYASEKPLLEVLKDNYNYFNAVNKM